VIYNKQSGNMHANKQLRVTVGPIPCSGCDESINNQNLCEIFIHRHQFAVYLSIISICELYS